MGYEKNRRPQLHPSVTADYKGRNLDTRIDDLEGGDALVLRFFEDFVTAFPQTGVDATQFGFLGQGRSATVSSGYSESGNAVDSTNHAVGVIKMNTGTDAAGWASVLTQDRALLGSVLWDLSIRLNIGALDDEVDTYSLVAGMHDTVRGTTLNPVDGAWFRYVHAINGDFWSCCTAAASNADPSAPTNFTETVTAVAPAVHSARMQILRIVRSASDVKFYIDGVLVATHTTNLPAAMTGVGIRILKTGGTTSRFLNLDYVDLRLSESLSDR